MLDCELFGLEPGPHHLTNLLFHIANTLILFTVLFRMTRAVWRSAFVAALFAVHPLHVESVAWIAERKNVLSTLFWLLTMVAYVRYVERKTLVRYLFVLSFLILGLMSKPMLVTLPFVLLLLDYWPLRRFQISRLKGQGTRPSDQKRTSPTTLSEDMDTSGRKENALGLMREKIPLLVPVAASCVVTFVVQQSGGSVGNLTSYPLKVRVANAIVCYVAYMAKMLWPTRLAIFYPYTDVWIGQVVGAGVLLAVISVLVIRRVRRQPYLTVGWLWYVGTLVPVIGLVQVGGQAMADRYTYVPLIGLFIIVAWGAHELLEKWRQSRMLLSVSSGLLLVACVTLTWLQVRHWSDSVALFKHAVAVTAPNDLARNNLGVALAEQGKYSEAAVHYGEAVKINPKYAEAYNNLGYSLEKQGQVDAAIANYRQALRINPDFARAHNNLGAALGGQGQSAEAVTHFQQALNSKQKNGGLNFSAGVHYNLALALNNLGQRAQATDHYYQALQGQWHRIDQRLRRSIKFNPNDANACNNLGSALVAQGKFDDAIACLARAVVLEPDDAVTSANLGGALLMSGKVNEARLAVGMALQVDPKNPLALSLIKMISEKQP